MDKGNIARDVRMLGAVDWNRRLFDSLIPLPDGTSYNSYLITGDDKTVLLDTVDPSKEDVLLKQLEAVPQLDYLVAHHAEQDHSGTIPMVLDLYSEAKVVCTTKCREMLIDLLEIDEERIITVEDGEEISLGDRTLKFVHTPWVHWPETMVSYLKEDKVLFSCDFFGSHLATTDAFVTNRAQVYEAAKRYYAEIMMPFRTVIRKNLEKLEDLEIDMIAPSHGPVYDEPQMILEAYSDWVSEDVHNTLVFPYVSMHGSTQAMVDHLVEALADRGVSVKLFDLAVTDIGKLAIELVDAATIVVGTPTVHVGPHPLVFYAAHLANALRPKLRFASVIGSYGWSSKAVERVAELIPNLDVEILDTVMSKGYPGTEDFKALDRLADSIQEKHAELNLI